MRTVVIIQKGSGEIYGVYSTWAVAQNRFSKFVGTIDIDTMKHFAKTYQSYKVEEERYRFREMSITKNHRKR